jgi:hypothetical protein
MLAKSVISTTSISSIPVLLSRKLLLILFAHRLGSRWENAKPTWCEVSLKGAVDRAVVHWIIVKLARAATASLPPSLARGAKTSARGAYCAASRASRVPANFLSRHCVRLDVRERLRSSCRYAVLRICRRGQPHCFRRPLHTAGPRHDQKVLRCEEGRHCTAHRHGAISWRFHTLVIVAQIFRRLPHNSFRRLRDGS